MTHWETYLAEHKAQFLDELLDFLCIPSISALPEHAADVQRAGAWVAKRLEAFGIENVEIMPTGGHPVVYGNWLHASGKPTIMIYGHFDTQPVDPLDLWESPPFEPVIRNDCIFARGASDDKGNLFAAILAVEALQGLRREGLALKDDGLVAEPGPSPGLGAALVHIPRELPDIIRNTFFTNFRNGVSTG